MGCPHLHPAGTDPASGMTHGLSQCDKYNTNPLRPIPPGGEAYCQAPGASGINCWLDLRACRKAGIAKRYYAYTVGDPYAGPALRTAVVDTDRLGRPYICLQQEGAWVHGDAHEFPMALVKD